MSGWRACMLGRTRTQLHWPEWSSRIFGWTRAQPHIPGWSAHIFWRTERCCTCLDEVLAHLDELEHSCTRRHPGENFLITKRTSVALFTVFETLAASHIQTPSWTCTTFNQIYLNFVLMCSFCILLSIFVKCFLVPIKQKTIIKQINCIGNFQNFGWVEHRPSSHAQTGVTFIDLKTHGNQLKTVKPKNSWR